MIQKYNTFIIIILILIILLAFFACTDLSTNLGTSKITSYIKQHIERLSDNKSDDKTDDKLDDKLDDNKSKTNEIKRIDKNSELYKIILKDYTDYTIQEYTNQEKNSIPDKTIYYYFPNKWNTKNNLLIKDIKNNKYIIPEGLIEIPKGLNYKFLIFNKLPESFTSGSFNEQQVLYYKIEK
jgi:hypothetical protein